MTLTHIDLDPGPTRHLTVTQKISGDRTGFDASVFLHVDHTKDGRILGVRFSEHRRDNSTLDKLLHALGDEATDVITRIQQNGCAL